LSIRLLPLNLDSLSSAISFDVGRVVVHPEFDPVRLRNNIAVLRLEEKINLDGLAGDGAEAACLPQCRGMFDFTFANGTGTLCWVAGFGEDADGTPTNVLRKVDLPLMNDGQCQDVMARAFEKDQPGFRLLQEEICAGGVVGKDACVGDGGSPLVCQVIVR